MNANMLSIDETVFTKVATQVHVKPAIVRRDAACNTWVRNIELELDACFIFLKNCMIRMPVRFGTRQCLLFNHL